MKKIKNIAYFLLVLFLLFPFSVFSQYIKSIQLRPLQENQFTAVVPLGKTLELSFDDLEGDQKEYYYKVEHMTHDWKPSNLIANQYINGFQQNTILNVSNSFNTLQNYTHYSVKIPNRNTIITKSGNYLISVLDEYDEIIFARRFTLYESKAIVGVVVNRSRDVKNLDEQQTVQFRVNHPELRINNPNQEVNVAVLQNNIWQSAITGLQPTFFKPNQLVYTHIKESNFWGENEFLHFDNKIIRNKSLNIRQIVKKDIFHHYLFPYEFRDHNVYTYNPDINGQYIIRTLEGNDPRTEADYVMMHFSLSVDEAFEDKEVYVYGAFNNFELTEENKMTFDEEASLYTASFLLKQGFYNYTFVTKNDDEEIDRNTIRGTFHQTENEYTVIVYFKPFGELYDRVIGVGTAYFTGER